MMVSFGVLLLLIASLREKRILLLLLIAFFFFNLKFGGFCFVFVFFFLKLFISLFLQFSKIRVLKGKQWRKKRKKERREEEKREKSRVHFPRKILIVVVDDLKSMGGCGKEVT